MSTSVKTKRPMTVCTYLKSAQTGISTVMKLPTYNTVGETQASIAASKRAMERDPMVRLAAVIGECRVVGIWIAEPHLT